MIYPLDCQNQECARAWDGKAEVRLGTDRPAYGICLVLQDKDRSSIAKPKKPTYAITKRSWGKFNITF